MKSGNLNFLEPSGTLQACNGTALPLLPSSVAILGMSLNIRNYETLRNTLPKVTGKGKGKVYPVQAMDA
jgi:hypothetical protein